MPKSPDAFRTISEVADWLGIQAHVLRFWESKFTQVKPIKRAGGRRYYRPGDMLLLGGIKKLLHDDGLTIKGVQKILREEGMSHVVDMSAPLDELTLSQLGDAKPAAPKVKPATAVAEPEEEKGIVLSFEGAAKPDPDGAADATEIQEVAKDSAPLTEPEPVIDEPVIDESSEREAVEPDPIDDELVEDENNVEVAPEPAVDTIKAPQEPEVKPEPVPDPETSQTAPEETEIVADVEVEPSKPQAEPSEPDQTSKDTAQEEPKDEDAEEPAPVAALPAFLRRPLADQDVSAKKPDIPAEPEKAPEVDANVSEPEAEPAAKKPRVLDLPTFTAEADFPAVPAALTAAFRARKIKAANSSETRALLQKLTALRDQMAARRRPSPPSSNKD